MKLIPSPLNMIDSFLLKSNIEVVEQDIDEKDAIDEIFINYVVDIDFFVKEINDTQFHVFSKAIINNGSKPKAGYRIFAESLTIFSIPDAADLKKAEEKNLKSISAIGIAIGNLRMQISNLTGNFPFGRYIMPALDINSLLKWKSEQYSKS